MTAVIAERDGMLRLWTFLVEIMRMYIMITHTLLIIARLRHSSDSSHFFAYLPSLKLKQIAELVLKSPCYQIYLRIFL